MRLIKLNIDGESREYLIEEKSKGLKLEDIAEVEMLDEMDRCYIFTKIASNCSVACGAGQIIARGLFKNIVW